MYERCMDQFMTITSIQIKHYIQIKHKQREELSYRMHNRIHAHYKQIACKTIHYVLNVINE